MSDKHAPYEKDKSLTEAQRQYKRVERWTKNVDLFEKDMVIFPICEEAHWLLVIAIKPGLIKVHIILILVIQTPKDWVCI